MPLTRPRASALTGHDVAAVAERDDRLLERAAELRRRPASPAADAAGRRRRGPRREGRRGAARPCRAARRPDRSCGPAWTAARAARAARDRARAAAAVGRRRGRREARGRIERVGDLEELRRVQPAASGGPLDRPARCRGPPRCRRRAAPGGAPGPGRSRRDRERPCTASVDGSSASASRRDGGRTTSPRPGARGRAGTRAGRWSAGPWPSARSSGAGLTVRTPRTRRPGLARVVDADPWRRPDPCGRPPPAASLETERRPRSHRSRPVQAVSMPNAAVTSPGPSASAVAGQRGESLGRSARPAPVSSRAVRARRAGGGPRASRRSPRAARPLGPAAAAGEPDGSVTTFRQSCIP